MSVTKLSQVTAEKEGGGSITIEDHENTIANNCMEMDSFNNIAKNSSVLLIGMNVDLSQ